MIRAVVIGARRKRQGTGPFVARSLAAAGAGVCGVVGTSDETVREAVDELRRDGCTECRGYTDVAAALAAERPDAVAICSPFSRHDDHLDIVAKHRCHCLCEKPLLWTGRGSARRAEQAVDRFAALGLHLDVLTQWPYTLEGFDRLWPGVRQERLETFEMHLAPISTGPRMVLDAASHPLSLLWGLAGSGAISATRAEYLAGDPRELCLDFAYRHEAGTARVRFRFTHVERAPRPASFTINGRKVERRIALPRYDIYLEADGRSVQIEDPLPCLVRDFLRRVEERVPVDRLRLIGEIGALEELHEAVENRGSGREEE